MTYLNIFLLYKIDFLVHNVLRLETNVGPLGHRIIYPQRQRSPDKMFGQIRSVQEINI